MNITELEILIGALSSGITAIITKFYVERKKFIKYNNENMKTNNNIFNSINVMDTKQNKFFEEIAIMVDGIDTRMQSVEKKINAIDSANERFKDAATVRSKIQKNCNDFLESFPTLSNELKLACKRGIEYAATYYKDVYIKKHFDKAHERDLLTNILKDIRSAVTYNNIEFYNENERAKFIMMLRNSLSNYIEKILNDIETFRAGNYNGKTFEVFVEMAVKNVNMIITITDRVYTDYKK